MAEPGRRSWLELDSSHMGRLRNTFRWLTFIIIAGAGAFLFTSGCVETAECDDSVRCPSGQICYELVCRTACTDDEICAEEEFCAPCQEDDGAAVIDHCYSRGEGACLPTP